MSGRNNLTQEWDDVEDFVSGKLEHSDDELQLAATAEKETEERRQTHIPAALLEAMEDQKDKAAIVAYAKEILKRRSDSPMQITIESDIGDLHAPVDAVTNSDSGMVAVRVRVDLWRLSLKVGVALRIAFDEKKDMYTFVGSLRLSDNIDMLIFVPYTPEGFDHTRV
jgi:hypothetical protein